MKFDNKTFQEKYEAWKNGADYWRDIRGINLDGDTQAEEPSAEEQLQIDQKVQSILNSYNEGKDVNIAEDIIKPLPFDTPLNEEHPILHKYKGGKDNLPIRSYKDFKNKLSSYWKEDISTHDYDYRKYYNDNPKEAYRQLNSILSGGHGHFPDVAKAVPIKSLVILLIQIWETNHGMIMKQCFVYQIDKLQETPIEHLTIQVLT